MFRRLWAKIKQLWKLAKEERASPRELFWAVFLGVFAGCTPAVGIHGWVAVGLATLFRKNRLWSWIGSRISNMVFLPFIAIAEVQIAHRLRVGAWVDLDREHALEQAGTLLLDWCLGTIPVGIVLGALLGAVAYLWQKRRLAKKALTPDAPTNVELTPAEPLGELEGAERPRNQGHPSPPEGATEPSGARSA